MMQGARKAKDFVNDYLKQDLPTRLVRYRNEWHLDDRALPEPEQYLTYEPLALDAWPTLITMATSTVSIQRLGFDDNAIDPLFRVAYSMRTYLWCRADDSDDVTRMRDDLTTVLRSALLDRLSLTKLNEVCSCNALIDDTTMREEFSDLTPLKGDRMLAGSYLSYTIHVNETSTGVAIAPVDSIGLIVKKFPLPDEIDLSTISVDE